MRSIGTIQDKEIAAQFCGYLNGSSIRAEIEQEEPGGAWTIWVHQEEKLEAAKSEFLMFQENLGDPKYRRIAKEADVQRRSEERAEARQRKMDAKLAKRIQGSTTFRVTYALMGISIVTYLLQQLGGGGKLSIAYWFLFDHGLVLQGQVWRVLTPVFLHLGILHILFNMMWMLDLGRILESHHNSRFLFIFFLVCGAGSNLFQAFLAPGVPFGGMSGVVYGLLGFIWMKARFQPECGLYLHPQTVTFMLVWLGLGFAGFMNMANGCHAGGLLVGTLWGYLSATTFARR